MAVRPVLRSEKYLQLAQLVWEAEEEE